MAQGYGYRSEQRLRKENQDTFGVFEFGEFTLLVVCDGMGGHVGGRQASSIAVRTIHDELKDYSGGDIRGALRRSIEAANRAIYEMARKNYRLMGMGTTCVAAVVVGHTAHVAHVGDSRAYLVRESQIRALTRDHTMVNLFVDAELLSPEDAATHPEAHVLSRSLGVERQVEVDLAEPLALQQGDRILLCSDGIHGVVGSSGLGGIDWHNPQEGVDAALTSVERAEGDDNATLVAWGLGISGASAPPTEPPTLESLEDETRGAPMQVGLQPVRRPTLVPQPTAGRTLDEEGPLTTIGDDDDTVPVAPTRAPPPRKRARHQGMSRRTMYMAGAFGAVTVVLAAVLLSGRNAPPAPATPPTGTTELTPVEPTTDMSAAVEPALVVPTGTPGVAPAEASLMANMGTRGMFRGRCLDCSGSFSPPDVAAYLAGSGDPEVAVAFFAPEIPQAPRRVPNTTSVYDHPPPSGPEQTKAVRAARNKRCREALDTVREAIDKSIDYASLYGAAWYCFNDTHTNVLARSRANTWRDFLPLLEHYEGSRRIQTGQFADAPSAEPEAAEGASGDDLLDGAAEDTDAPAELPDQPDTWSVAAAGGIEYRLALFEIDRDVQGFSDIMVDLLGEPTVADHLAADVLLEATAAAAVARMEQPTPEALQAWARRVYVASRAMTGPIGELIRAHRPEVAGTIEALLFEATGGDEGLVAIEEGYPNDAVPPVVARAQAAGLAGQMPSMFGEAGADLAALDEFEIPDPTMQDGPGGSWRAGSRDASPTRSGTRRRSYRGNRSSAQDDVDALRDPSDFDWDSFGYLKVWYPRQRMPRVLRPYQGEGEPLPPPGTGAARTEDVEVYRRNSEQLDADWEAEPR